MSWPRGQCVTFHQRDPRRAGFAFLVIPHELGHFTVAKLVGMRVEKFSLFFHATISPERAGRPSTRSARSPRGAT